MADSEGQTIFLVWRNAGSIRELIDVVSTRKKAAEVDFSQYPLYDSGMKYMVEEREVH